MKKTFAAGMVILAISAGAAYGAITNVPGQGVKGSAHDMAAAIPGAIDAQGRICAFCHTPHHANTAVASAPLWSRGTNGATYQAYKSGTFDVVNSAGYLGDPAYGVTRLCLSCHDSGIAAGTHYNIAGGDGVTGNLGGDSYGGFDIGAGSTLANDHPLGFDYAAVVCSDSPSDNTVQTSGTCNDGTKIWVRSLGALGSGLTYIDNSKITVNERLDNGIMTCATCHDVHNKKNLFDSAVKDAGENYFVLSPQKNSALCLTCHIK